MKKSGTFIIAFIVVLICFSQVQAVSVPSTGQALCYDTTGHLANCKNSGQDGEIKTGAVPPVPRFTDNSDGTVTDNFTGLIWLKTGAAKGVAMTWQGALDMVKEMNQHPDAYGRGGYFFDYRDWRLPSKNELKSLIDYQKTAPALTGNHPFLDLHGWYWSSTSSAADSTYAWGVSLSDGSTGVTAKTGMHYAWPVRAGQSNKPAKPIISAAPESGYFGTRTISGESAARTIKIFNLGNANLVINDITLAGTDSDQFLLSSNTCSGQIITAGSHCSFIVTFDPDTIGTKTAHMIINNTDANTPALTINLSGVGGTLAIPAKSWVTGQTTCHDTAGKSISCAVSGQDGDNPRGAVFPLPRFTDTGDGAVTDTLTGLVWLKSSNCFDTTDWQGALDAVKMLNAAPENYTCSGYNKTWRDWRLPSRKELLSLVDRSQSIPALPEGHPFDQMTGNDFGDYWASSSLVGNPANAWRISMANGSVSAAAKSTKMSVWPVRVGHSEIINGPNLVILPPQMNYESVDVKASSQTKRFEIRNTGTQALTISSVTKTGPDAAMFMVSNNSCAAVTLNPYEYCELDVTFSPSTEGDKTAQIAFASNDWNSPVKSLQLIGTTYAFVTPSSLWKTGQEECFDTAGQPAGCSGSGQDGEVVFGAVWPEPRFKDNADGTLTDHLTGLMWLKSANFPSSAVNWQQALDLAADLNLNPDEHGRGGYIANYRDWRLPNRKELLSLIDRSQNSPALPDDHLFKDVQAGSYWTSTTMTNQNGSDSSWGVSFTDGSVFGLGKYTTHFFLAVRKGRTIKPAIPVISLIPESNLFPVTPVGQTSAARTVKIINQGTAGLTVHNTILSGQQAGNFSISNNTCTSQTLAPEGECTLDVSFSPATSGEKTAGLTIASNDPVLPVKTIAISGSTSAYDPPYRTVQTGQTLCHDVSGTKIECQTTGQDGQTSTGQAWPQQRFVDNQDGTITDNLTGLIWLKSGDCNQGTASWQEVLGIVADLNSNPAGFTCGGYNKAFSDWRLPNRSELRSLVDYSKSNPALLAGHPFEHIKNTNYWTATTDISNLNNAWTVSLADGGLGSNAKTGSHQFLAVRSGLILPPAPVIHIDPEKADFGSMLVNRTSQVKRFRINNTGRSDLTIHSISLTGSDAGMFSRSNDQCSGNTIAPGRTCTFDMSYRPISQGPKGAQIIVDSNDPVNPRMTVPLSGDTDRQVTDATPITTGLDRCYDTGGHRVECINSGQDAENKKGVKWPGPRFIDNRDGTVEDKLTGLVWLKSADIAEGTLSHTRAIEFIKDLNTHPDDYGRGGYFKNFTDWRLPNRNELLSLISYANTNPALPADAPFVDLFNEGYWSSTTITSTGTSAWSISFSDGSVSAPAKTTQLRVIPVRLGKTGLSVKPILYTAPESKNFGYLPSGSTSTSEGIIVYNLGSADLHISQIVLTGSQAAEFEIVDDHCSGMSLLPEGECTLNTVFKPVISGNKLARMVISSNDPENPAWEIPLRGTTNQTAPARIWKTGQAACYDTGGHLTGCGQSDQDDGEGDSAKWPVPRFVEKPDGTVSDSLTGLMWVKGFDLPDAKLNWENALGFIAQLNLNYHKDDKRGGYTARYRDWRLPNRKELMSLIDRSKNAPALPQDHPFTDVFNDRYWTATTVTSATINANDAAWTIALSDGSVSGDIKYNKNYVAAVRGGFTDEPAVAVAGVSPEPYHFGYAIKGTASAPRLFTVTNYGTALLSISEITLSGTDNTDFKIQNNTCGSSGIGSLDTCQFEVVFAPLKNGISAADIVIHSNDPDTPAKHVALSGSTLISDVASAPATTGQTTCHDTAGNLMSCDQTGQDGDSNKGLAFPIPRFTDNSDGTVKDSLTGLIWMKSGSCTTKGTFQQALDTAKDLNTNPSTYICGGYNQTFTDWRLPNRKELLSLIDRSVSGPAIKAESLFQGIANDSYWTSTTDTSNYNNAWVVSLSEGSVSSSAKSDSHYSWFVRIGSTAQPIVHHMVVTPKINDFGSTHVGHTSSVNVFSVKNQGNSLLNIGTIAILGSDSNQFNLIDDLCSNTSLSPGDSCAFSAAFSPTGKGEKYAGIAVPSNDPHFPAIAVELLGLADEQALDGSLYITGQTRCYDMAGHLTNCQTSNQDGATQAGITMPTPRYVDNQDGTVTDRLTSLVWLKSAGMAEQTLTWQAALEFVSDINTHPDDFGRGGYFKRYTDWRLPNRTELKSHILFSQSSPAITPNHPFVDLAHAAYWTSTTTVGTMTNAFMVNMSDGSIGASTKTDKQHVWLVRAGKINSSHVPIIFVLPETIDFNIHASGMMSSAHQISVKNDGKSNLVIGSVSIGGIDNSQFTIQDDLCSDKILTENATCSLNVVFNPDTDGEKTASVLIPSNDAVSGQVSIALNGRTQVPDIPARVGETGQQRCYDAAGHLTNCYASGQDADTESGAAWPKPRFIDNNDGTITDTFTGFMWLKCTKALGVSNWQGALDAVKSLNTSPNTVNCSTYTKAYTDWKLPNRFELKSIIDYSQHAPAIQSGHPFENASESFWSSTTVRNTGENDHDWAWGVSLDDGSVSKLGKSGSYHAWAVRAITAGAPMVSTGSAKKLLLDSVELNGDVRPMGNATSYYFEYGLTDQYGSLTLTVNAEASTGVVQARAILTNLILNKTYHYRLVATNTNGTATGENKAFTTGSTAVPPTVVTMAASNVTSDTAQLNGSVNANDLVTDYYFEYGTTTAYGSVTPTYAAGAGSNPVLVNKIVSGLSANTTYYYRIVASNALGTSTGVNKTFTTDIVLLPPTVSTGDAIAVDFDRVTLTGAVNPNGSDTTYSFEYGITAAYGSQTTATDIGNDGNDVSVNIEITNLTPNTTYHYRITANNTTGIKNGEDKTFKTLSAPVSLKVSILPEKAVTEGAKWQINKGPWQVSGDVLSNLPTGSYKISFNEVANWNKPDDKTITVQAGKTLEIIANYTPFQFVLPGDINNDGKVNLSDTLHGLKVLTSYPDIGQKEASIDGDQKVGIADVIGILQNQTGSRDFILTAPDVVLLTPTDTECIFPKADNVTLPEIGSVISGNDADE